MQTFTSVYHSKERIFYGLSKDAIKYLYENGMWVPVNYEVLEINRRLAHSTELVYGTYKDKDFVMVVIVDRGEMLLGKIWNVVVNSDSFGPLILHEYVMEDGTTIKELDQLILDNIAFKYLIDNEENIISQWEEEDIEKVLNTIK